MAKQYKLHSYDFRPRPGDFAGEDAQSHMDAMTDDGWVVHTANVMYPEAHVLWERDAPEENHAESNENHDDEHAGHAEAAGGDAPAASHRQRGKRAGAPTG